MPFGLVQKNYLVTYNRQYGNEFFIQIPQRPTFNMTKAGLLYHDTRQILKKKDGHIMANNSHFPILQDQDKNKRYTAHNIKRVYHARLTDILSHPYILSQDWKVLHDVIINYMEDSFYRLNINVLESPCMVNPFYIVGSVSFILVLIL